MIRWGSNDVSPIGLEIETFSNFARTVFNTETIVWIPKKIVGSAAAGFGLHGFGESTMPLDPRTPVLVGVAQLAQRVDDPLTGDEPLEMMITAVEAAARDAGSKEFAARADAVCVIRGRWRYTNPAGVVRERIGAATAQTAITPYGGNMVQSAVNHYAGAITRGERDIVVFAGAEHGRSQARARKQGVELEYTDTPGEADVTIGLDVRMVSDAEMARKIVRPIAMYPIFENAIRRARGESIEEHRRVSPANQGDEFRVLPGGDRWSADHSLLGSGLDWFRSSV